MLVLISGYCYWVNLINIVKCYHLQISHYCATIIYFWLLFLQFCLLPGAACEKSPSLYVTWLLFISGQNFFLQNEFYYKEERSCHYKIVKLYHTKVIYFDILETAIEGVQHSNIVKPSLLAMKKKNVGKKCPTRRSTSKPLCTLCTL